MDAAIHHAITADDILTAYRIGIFPMADDADDPKVFWLDPEKRGILPLDKFHIPNSLKKSLKKQCFRVSVNKAFDEVIASCAARTPVRSESWINDTIRAWFCELHRKGHAHSVECWDSNGRLAGGLYGLSINAAFFGESMFSRVEDASKVALVYLAARLHARGFKLLDCQFVNPHLLQFGCIEIPREDYHSLLGTALSVSGVSFIDSSSSNSSSETSSAGGVCSFDCDWSSLSGFLQSRTVTS